MSETTFVIGLDGAHWELLDPWIEAGHLPTLAKLKNEGTWGDLESCLPPVTCPNWKCYSTGKNPGKLGAFWWEKLDKENRRIDTVDNSTFSTPELWDYLNYHGISTAVVNMPTTYPPRKVDGCMIAGGPDAERDDYTYPKNLQEQLKSEYDYELRPKDMYLLPDNKSKVADEVNDLIDTRFDVALDLAADHDFVHLTIFYINVLQHFFWRDEIVLNAWKRIDANLARVLDRDANVLIMSDHGSNEIQRVFWINSWLEKEGYLKLNRDSSDVLSSFGLTTDRIKKFFSQFGANWYLLAKRIAPDTLTQKIPRGSGGLTKGAKASKIDWESTTAVAGGQGPIYLLTEDRDIQDDLLKKLEEVEDPKTNENPINSVNQVDEVYHGDAMAHAPDIVIDQTPGWHVPGHVGHDSIFSAPGQWAAENKRTGLFAMFGPVFEGTKLGDLSILDLAPTLLHLHSCPIPETMDGTIATQAFANETKPAKKRPNFVKDYTKRNNFTEGVSTESKQRLKELGYL